MSAEVVVLRFGTRRVPRALSGLAVHDVGAPTDVDPLVGAGRMIVVGDLADLGTVLTRLLRADRLDVEVGLVSRPWHARRARTGAARRVPLIRDETGTVVTGAAFWLPPDEDARNHRRRGRRRRRRAVRRRGDRRARRADRRPAWPSRQRVDGPDAAAPVGHRARCPTRHDGRARGARRRCGPASGPSIHLLPPHAGLAGRSVTVVSTR